MSEVVDASIAVKWMLKEEGSDQAHALLEAESLIAPDFLMLECANVFALRVRRKLWNPSQAREALAMLEAMPLARVPSHPHIATAHKLAVELVQTAYDSLYLALALAEGVTLVTADRRFAEAVQREPAYASAIRLL